MIIETSLQVVENFLPSFYSYRNWATNLEYRTHKYYGEDFSNVSADWGRYPNHLLSEVVGFPVETTLSMLRYSTVDSQVELDVHSDLTVDGCTHASVLYMSTPEQDAAYSSGTAFFRNKETGLRGFGPRHAMQETGFTDDIIKKIQADGSDPSKWKLEGFTSMKSNRLIVYPSSLFHSKYGESFGEDQTTGRLIWVNFFREA